VGEVRPRQRIETPALEKAKESLAVVVHRRISTTAASWRMLSWMAAHESPRTTKLYDRNGDEITLDEVERIVI
jgi:hypothetical protein